VDLISSSEEVGKSAIHHLSLDFYCEEKDTQNKMTDTSSNTHHQHPTSHTSTLVVVEDPILPSSSSSSSDQVKSHINCNQTTSASASATAQHPDLTEEETGTPRQKNLDNATRTRWTIKDEAMFFWKNMTLSELSGSLGTISHLTISKEHTHLHILHYDIGDLGTLLPILVGLAASGQVSLTSSLVFGGVFNIITGFVYRIPVKCHPFSKNKSKDCLLFLLSTYKFIHL
jgi:hypothetical protein